MCLILVSVKSQAALMKYFPALLLNSTGGRIKQAQAQFEDNFVSAKLTSPPKKKIQFHSSAQNWVNLVHLELYYFGFFMYFSSKAQAHGNNGKEKNVAFGSAKKKMANFIFGLSLVINSPVNFLSDYLNVFPLL